MKKLYTLILAAATAASVSAAVDFQAHKSLNAVARTLKASSEIATQKVESEAIATPITASNKTQSIATIDDLCNTYTWEYYSYLNSDQGNNTSSITISRVEGSADQLSLVGLYATFPVTATVDLEKGTLTIPKQVMFTNTYYNKDVLIWYNYWNPSGQGNNDSEDPIVMTINKETGVLAPADYDNIVIGIPGLGYFLFAGSNTFTPLASENSMSVTLEDCADENKYSAKFLLGSGIASYKLMIMSGHYSGSQQLYQLVAQYAEKSFPATSTNISINGANYDTGAYSILAAGLDESGNVVGGTVGLFFITQDDSDNWTTIEGAATYGEDLMNSLYQNFSVDDYEVAIQKHNTTEGLYRLVNPYQDPYPNASKNRHAGTHNHYIFIHAEDPDKVYLSESSIGYDLGDGTAFISSMVQDGMDYYGDKFNPEDFAKYYGKMDAATRTITFPTNALLIGEARYENGSMYYANSHGGFKVVLPENSAVAGISVDAAAPAEYYNLQGVRVENPAAGQLLIKRQGGEVSKILVK